MRRAPFGAAFVASVFGLLACACSDDEPKAVKQASCNAVCTRSYTEATCKAAAAGAGCEKNTFIASVPGCTNGCSFEDCDRVPSCGAGDPVAGQ